MGVTFTLRELVECAEREVRLRRRVYPNRIETGRMSPALADRQIANAWKDVPVYQLPQKTRDVYRGHGHRTDEEWFGYKADNARLLAAAEPEKRKEIEDILSKG